MRSNLFQTIKFVEYLDINKATHKNEQHDKICKTKKTQQNQISNFIVGFVRRYFTLVLFR